MTEINEVAMSFFDGKTVAAFNRYSDLIEYVHISDRYSGPKSPEYVFMVYFGIILADREDKKDLYLILKIFNPLKQFVVVFLYCSVLFVIRFFSHDLI